MGGVFNAVNLNLWHYGGNNPIKYSDPDGRHASPWANFKEGENDLLPYAGSVNTGAGNYIDSFVAGFGALWNLAAGTVNGLSNGVAAGYNLANLLTEMSLGMSIDDITLALGPYGAELRAIGVSASTMVNMIKISGGNLGKLFTMLTGAGGRGPTLKLPGSMANELPAYQRASENGSLVRTQSSALPRSTARSNWEAANGPVPNGFDVDHIIQRQFGGGDELTNLQLKPSSLNRAEGASAYQLNKSNPYETIFTGVELVP